MNIVGCVGLSHDSRDSYLSRLESGIRIFDWLRVDRWELPSSTILCAAHSTARVTLQNDKNGARLHLGSVTNGNDGHFLSGLRGDIYLAFTCRDGGDCSVGVDPLGLFPLYYYSTPKFLLFSSS